MAHEISVLDVVRVDTAGWYQNLQFRQLVKHAGVILTLPPQCALPDHVGVIASNHKYFRVPRFRLIPVVDRNAKPVPRCAARLTNEFHNENLEQHWPTMKLAVYSCRRCGAVGIRLRDAPTVWFDLRQVKYI
jgi:hypothetical protein